MTPSSNMRATRRRRKRSGNLIVGLAFLIAGSLLFAREFGADLPWWFFRWEMILIIIGISIGVKSGFRDFGWIVVAGLGFFFLSDEIFPGWNPWRYVLPAGLLAVGAFIILQKLSPSQRPREINPNESGHDESGGVESAGVSYERPVAPTEIIEFGDPVPPSGYMEPEQLDVVSVFSAVNKKVFSKNFVGGEIVCVFGGSEINLMNADISAGTIELEVVCIFGGATLFIPHNWYVRSDMGSVFGGIDDKRKNVAPIESKTLIIKGVCIFGGLEIKTKYA
jgi:hypothetical protein